jgi:hypothetical protein
MANTHVDVPPPAERSVIAKKAPAYYKFTYDWQSGSKPWHCQAHHILPGQCFSMGNLQCDTNKKHYVMRCIWVSKWNINGGAKHDALQKPIGQNNMMRLPTRKGYIKTYAKVLSKFKSSRPENLPMHGWGGWSEHNIYNKEVMKWLNDKIFSTLQEDKVKHKAKGKDILAELQGGEAHFRAELIRRGSRNGGTITCWLDPNRPRRSLPFSMADDPGPRKKFVTQNPT